MPRTSLALSFAFVACMFCFFSAWWVVVLSNGCRGRSRSVAPDDTVAEQASSVGFARVVIGRSLSRVDHTSQVSSCHPSPAGATAKDDTIGQQRYGSSQTATLTAAYGSTTNFVAC